LISGQFSGCRGHSLTARSAGVVPRFGDAVRLQRPVRGRARLITAAVGAFNGVGGIL